VALAIARAAGPFPDFAAAIQAYLPLAARDPENPLVNLRLADALLRAGRPRDAAPYFQRVVDAGPRTADAHVGLATAFAQLDRLDAAQRVLDRALSVDPGNGQVHYNLGEIARVREDWGRARREYEAALRDPATTARARERLAALP
jgi:Tfp pilus assembly protein PilF